MNRTLFAYIIAALTIARDFVKADPADKETIAALQKQHEADLAEIVRLQASAPTSEESAQLTALVEEFKGLVVLPPAADPVPAPEPPLDPTDIGLVGGAGAGTTEGGFTPPAEESEPGEPTGEAPAEAGSASTTTEEPAPAPSDKPADE